MRVSIHHQVGVGEEVKDHTRSDLVAENIESWKRSLQETISKSVGSRQLELSAAHPSGLASLYSGRPTPLSSLVREPRSLAHARLRAREVAQYSRKLRLRYGIGALQLAIGTATWDREDGGHTSCPVLLCPVELEVLSNEEMLLTMFPFPQLSPVLEEELMGAGVRGYARDMLGKAGHGPSVSFTEILDSLRELGVGYIPGFSLYDSLTVGAYVHPLTGLLDDLENMNAKKLKRFSDSELLAAISGDEQACEVLMQCELPKLVGTDRDPRAEHGVGDLDAAQHHILDCVATGVDLYLKTGAASENDGTVAAILADAVSEGQNVAYVCSDPAQAQILTQRMQELGLEDLVLDFSNYSEPELIQKLARSLDRALFTAAQGDTQWDEQVSKLRANLIDTRQALGGYLEQLHRKREPWGISAYDALQVLTDLTANRNSAPRTKVRFDLPTLHRLAADGALHARTVLQTAQEKGIFIETRASNPWIGVVISSPEMVKFVVDAVKHVAATELPQVRNELERTCMSTGLKPAQTLNQWQDQLRMLEGIYKVLQKFRPQVFEQSVADMVIATASKKWRVAHGYNMKLSQRRRLVRQAKSLICPGVKLSDLHEELVEVQRQRQIWREYSQSGGWPTLPEGLTQMRLDEARLREWLGKLQPFFSTGYGDLVKIPLDQLTVLLRTLAQDHEGAAELPERVALLKEIHELGLDELLADLRARRCQGNLVREELDLAWWASALTEILKLDERLTQYDSQTLQSLTTSLRELDRQQVLLLAPCLFKQVNENLGKRLNGQPETIEELKSLLQNPTLSITDLFHQLPLVLQLVPIMIMPPSVVPNFIGLTNPLDLVVIDASQECPINMYASTIARSRQVIAVGQGNDPLAQCLPQLALPQNRERINAWVLSLLSAHNAGEGQMVAVPSPRPSASVRYHAVEGRALPALGSQTVESSPQEVEEIMRLVREHVLCRPGVSLAVVALNKRHAQRLQEAFLSQRNQYPELEVFLQSAAEPFVIVEPEQARGLKRDRVIIGVGYARTPHGMQLHDFGEISGPRGCELLTAALSCVREDIDIVSSLDIDLISQDRLHTQGAWMLYDMLLRAYSNGNLRARIALATGQEANAADGENTSDNNTTSASRLEKDTAQDQKNTADAEAQVEVQEIDDRLLLDLAERLYGVGLEVVPQYGAPGQWKVPLALGHPDFPGEMLLAVLTDGEEYVADKSQRSRVRHWPERLEAYGWAVETVYSTSVFRDPSEQASRLLNRVLDLVEERKRLDPRFEGTVSAVVQEPVFAGQEREQQLEAEHQQTIDGIYGQVTGEIAAVHPETGEGDVLSASLPGEGTTEITGELVLSEIVEEKVYGESEDQHAFDPFRPFEQGGVPVGQRVGVRPPVAPGLPLSAYSDDQLDDLLHWLRSDRIARTQGQELDLLRRELDLLRPSAQVDLILNNVIRRNP